MKKNAFSTICADVEAEAMGDGEQCTDILLPRSMLVCQARLDRLLQPSTGAFCSVLKDLANPP